MKTRTLQTALLTALAWTVFALSATGQALAPVQDSPDGPWYMPGEILIKFKAEATDAELQDAVRRAGVGSVKHIQTRAMKAHGDHGITRADTAQPVAQAIKALQNHPAVEYAQPNWVYKHQAVSNDPYLIDGSLWGMYGASTTPANQYGSGAAAAWTAGSIGSSSVYIGIIDEGIQFDHPDLAANMWVNPGEFGKTAGVDDDANGYIDDIYGWNGISDNGNIYEGTSDDHGTHVAGTIGAQANNTIGVVGVSWNVKLISGKFLGPNGGTTADAVQAIDYMTDLKTTKGLNIVALNNSWGGGAYDQTLLASIVRAAKAQILFVAAAGNGDWRNRAINTDLTSVYPPCYDTTTGAGYDSVIAVTAISSSGAKPSWANYGAQTVDLGAPGVGILSTVPGGSYATADGTSMATPHVTGAIALYAAKYPTANASEVKSALLASTAGTPSLANTTAMKGRLDIVTFLAASPPGWVPPEQPIPPPAAPTDLKATAISHSKIELTWKDNSNNETEFVITRSGRAEGIRVPANLTTFTDTGLAAGTTYTYSIQACNGNCTSGVLPALAPASTLSAPVHATVARTGIDDTTKGNWIGNYGSDGYDLFNSTYKMNSGYVTPMPAGYAAHTWASSNDDPRALQTPDGLLRFAACYYSFDNFTIDLNFTDGKAHRVSLYCVDFDSNNFRKQSFRIFDRNYGNEIANTAQSLDTFNGGKYVTWNITGPVIIKIIDDSPLASDNAVVSGIFFDPAADVVIPEPPDKPSGLTATPGIGQVTLNWTGSSGATSYNVKRSTTSGYEVRIATTTATTYADSNVVAGNTYYYVVSAVSLGGESPNSSEVNAVPTAPPDFTVTASPTSQTVKRGTGTSYTIMVTSSSGFQGNVELSVSGLPSGASHSFSVSPVSVAANGSAKSTLTVTTGSKTATGTKTLTITGISGSLQHNTTVQLQVTR